ncbi:hypothetical protein [Pseudonocardia alni]
MTRDEWIAEALARAPDQLDDQQAGVIRRALDQVRGDRATSGDDLG